MTKSLNQIINEAEKKPPVKLKAKQIIKLHDYIQWLYDSGENWSNYMWGDYTQIGDGLIGNRQPGEFALHFIDVFTKEEVTLSFPQHKESPVKMYVKSSLFKKELYQLDPNNPYVTKLRKLAWEIRPYSRVTGIKPTRSFM
jgi:hypothetical protein